MHDGRLHFSRVADRLVGSPMFEMLARVEELERQGQNIIHFEIGDPDFDTPPHIVDVAVAALKGGDTHYGNAFGLRELREAICESIRRDRGFLPNIDQVVVAPAISFVYFIVNCLADSGDEIVVADPDYSSYFSAFNLVGVRSVTVPLSEQHSFRMQAADLEKVLTQKTRLVILNSPQNPTGAMIAPSELKKIFELARAHNFFVLSDEVYSKLVYDCDFQSISTHDKCLERTIILNGFSKTYAMTGWRLGYAVAPSSLVEKIGLMIQTIISNVPPFIQRAGVAALMGDQRCVEEMRTTYMRRREIIVRGLNELSGIRCLAPDGAFYVFPNIEGTGMPSVEFSEFLLEKARVAVLPGVNFGARGE